jgi:hypothetical protein
LHVLLCSCVSIGFTIFAVIPFSGALAVHAHGMDGVGGNEGHWCCGAAEQSNLVLLFFYMCLSHITSSVLSSYLDSPPHLTVFILHAFLEFTSY